MLHRLFLSTLVAATLVALLVGCSGKTTSGGTSTGSSAKKAEMREQRLAYENWSAEDKTIRLAEKDLRILKQNQGDPQQIAKLEKDVAAAKQRQQGVEEKAKQRWGKHPKEFADLPASDAKFYTE